MNSMKLKTTLQELNKKILNFLKNGGIKLKLIGFTIGIIVITVVILSTIIINLMTNSIEKKSFDVVTSSINHIGNFSRQSLLERTYENRLNLSELVKKIQNSNIEGFIDISIYEREKIDNINQFKYLTGFKKYEDTNYLDDKALIEQLNNTTSSTISRKDILIKEDNKEVEAYQFTKPIIYNFKDQTILLGVVVLSYGKDAIYGIINQVINISIFIALIIIVIATIIVYLSGQKFTRPILEITKAADKVSKDDLDIELNIKTNDEIETLANRFNSMVNGLRERRHMQKFVSGSTMNMIQKDTKKELLLGGEYRTETFLFSDIRGFTAMSEEKTPDEVVEIVNFYLNLQSEIIKSNGGDIDKFVGDEIMASFSGEKSNDNAINCAIKIQEAILKENIKREKNNQTVCNVGIGINQGKVIVGNIGAHDRMDFTAIGSSVNLAARLCSHAKANEILVEEKTMQTTSLDVKSTIIEPIEAKGIKKPIEVRSIST